MIARTNPEPQGTAARLAKLAERYWAYECEETPFAPILAGQAVQGKTVFRESGADHWRRATRAAALLEDLHEIDPSILSGQDRATHGLLDRELKAVGELHAVGLHLRPWLLPGGPDFNIAFFANSTTIADRAGAELYLVRLESLSSYVDDMADNLRAGHATGIRYPASVLKAAATSAQTAAAIAPEDTPSFQPFRRSVVADDPVVRAAADQARGVIADRLLPALDLYADLLAGPLSVGAGDSLSCTSSPGGADFYRAMVRYFTTTNMSPGAVHDLGLAEVERIGAALAEIAASEGVSVADYRAALVADPTFISPSPETLLLSMQSLCKRIDRLIPAWFGRIPRATYGVDSIAAAASAALPPAYAQPGSADGSSPGLFWVSGLPEKCPSFMHAALAVHEAWPGHLMHIALLQELDEFPAFRRFGAVKYTACVEGWALYCEGLADKMGLYPTAAERFGWLEMEMWRALRLVVDTGIHWHGWSRDQAIDLMTGRLSLSRDTIAAEVDRYAAMPGQALAYQIGNLKMRDLRRRAEHRLGACFSHRAFHEAVMTAGAVTLPLLDDLIDAWIERAAA